MKAGQTAAPPNLEKLLKLQQGMSAAADVRAQGGLPDHIDAVGAPTSCEIAGVTLYCYPIATYCALRVINPWLNAILQREARVQAATAAQSGNADATFNIPVEVMLAQVFAFAQPTPAYFRARNGEADYLNAAFAWFDQHLATPLPSDKSATSDPSDPPSDRWHRLGQCYRFVLEQTGILEAVNPPPPASTTTAPLTTPAIPNPAAPETPSTSPPEATPVSSPPSSIG